MRGRGALLVSCALIVAACGIDARGSLGSDEQSANGSSGAGSSGSTASSSSGSAASASSSSGGDAPDAGTTGDGGTNGLDAGNDAGNGAQLTWSRVVPPATVDLTAQGPLDWAHWGANGNAPNRKSGVTTLISDYTNTGSPSIGPSANNPSSFGWQDGTPSASESGTTSHVFFKGEANVTVTLSVATAATMRRSLFYLCLNRTRARFEIDFTDGSIATTSEELEKNDGAMCVRYDVDYRAPNASARLRVRWTMLTVVDPANSSVRISAVTVRSIP